MPEVKTNLEYTELKLWHVDLTEAYPDLSDSERQVFTYMYKTMPFAKFNNIKNATGLTEYKLRKILESLEKKGLIKTVGSSRATQYVLQDSYQIVERLKHSLERLQQNL